MKEDFEQASRIVNGYWYTFEYLPSSQHISMAKDDVPDTNPFLYVIGPSEKDPNSFIALNMHKFPYNDRKKLFLQMVALSHFNEDDTRHFMDASSLRSMGINNTDRGIRYYSRKNIRGPAWRIKNAEVGKYLSFNGNFIGSNPSEQDIQFNLASRK